MTEPELIDGLKRHDQQAFRTLVEKYRDQVYRTSYGLILNAEDAEDIAQDVFIEVFQSIDNFRGDARLSTWLYRITINKSLNLIRKNKRKEWLVPLESLFWHNKSETRTMPDSGPYTANVLLEETERNRILDKAISDLPDNQRIAFTLHKIEELPHKEIARIMENSVSSVESLIFRAKMNLQKKLSAYYKL